MVQIGYCSSYFREKKKKEKEEQAKDRENPRKLNMHMS